MHYLNTDPVVMDDSALQALIGPIRKTSYPDGVKQCLSALRAGAPGGSATDDNSGARRPPSSRDYGTLWYRSGLADRTMRRAPSAEGGRCLQPLLPLRIH